MTSSDQVSSPKRVVVVGGNFAGGQFITDLEDLLKSYPYIAKITLIDRRDGRLWNIASPRALTEPGFHDKTRLPFSRFFKTAELHRGRVTEIHEHEVRLEDGTSIQFDYLVVATGSQNAAPGKYSSNNDLDEIRQEQQRLFDAVKAAQNVLVVGGGSTGIEVAGDIKQEYPKKHVTLVHSSPQLFNNPVFKPSLGEKLQQKLTGLGVELVLGDRVDVPLEVRMKGYNVGQQTIVTQHGKQIDSDLRLFTVGNESYNTAIFQSLGGEDVVDPSTGLVKVLPTLQLAKPGLGHIFAIGDISNADTMKMAYVAGLQGTLAANNVNSLILGRSTETLQQYKPQSPGQFVTTGRTGGAGQLPNGWVVGNLLVRWFKAGDFMTGRFAKLAVRPESVAA